MELMRKDKSVGLALGIVQQKDRQWLQQPFSILVLSSLILFIVVFFFNVIVPQTQGRMGVPSSNLINDFPLWRFILSAKFPVSENAYTIAIFLILNSVIAFLAYILAIYNTWDLPNKRKYLLYICCIASLCYGISVFALPNVNNDIYNYILRGRLGAIYHENPYVTPADNFPRDPVYPFANHAYTAHPGGKLPFWMNINIFLARISGNNVITNLIVYRLAFLIFNFANLFLIYFILKRIHPGNLLSGLVMYAWNPIVLIYAQSKTDTVMVFLVLFSVFLMLTERRIFAMISLTLSVSVKLVTLPMLAIYWLNEFRKRNLQSLFLASFFSIIAVILVYLPFLSGLDIFLFHINGAWSEVAAVPVLIRYLRLIIFALLVLGLGLRQHNSLKKLFSAWVASLIYLFLFLTNFGLSWYFMTLIAVVSLMSNLKFIVLTVMLSFFSFIYNCWYMTFNTDFHIKEIASIPDKFIFFLLPGLALLCSSAIFMVYHFVLKRESIKNAFCADKVLK
jgi:hypothetical protein